ncbi:DUF1579 domain-containing protein [Taibaiella koreensis]|uniref:DUF1579 domain-containing protein n=1 Tax=Taibaiella koreensis TaxID=1268548 RepID=UPI000E59EAA3|nr:DUF1579 domain-containing protein [Taibaiella koreensis]
MKKLLLLSATLISLSAVAQTAEEKAWMAFMTPGEQHQMMAKDNGKWNEEITFYMTPGAPPTSAKASCTNEMILGGRYQRSVHTGDMMGMPFEGISTTGYDNGRKVFFSTWIDNMGTGVMYMEGKYDATKKMLELKGTTTDPATGKAMPVRQTMRWIDDNTQEMEMYNTAKGKEYKSMVIKFSRAS